MREVREPSSPELYQQVLYVLRGSVFWRWEASALKKAI